MADAVFSKDGEVLGLAVGMRGLRRRDGADQQAVTENALRGPGVLSGVHQERKEPETHPRPLRDETAPPSAGGPGGVASEGRRRPNGEVHPERFRPVRENRRENSPPKTPKPLEPYSPKGSRWSECNYRTCKSPGISMVCRPLARGFITKVCP